MSLIRSCAPITITLVSIHLHIVPATRETIATQFILLRFCKYDTHSKRGSSQNQSSTHTGVTPAIWPGAVESDGKGEAEH